MEPGKKSIEGLPRTRSIIIDHRSSVSPSKLGLPVMDMASAFAGNFASFLTT